MKHLLNTLYVTNQGAYLSREGETVLVRVDGEIKIQLPIHTLGSVVCFGQVSCSPPLLGLCAERHVSVSFLSMNGRFLARVEGPVSGNVFLRREQYRQADSLERSAFVARAVVIAKIANCRTILLRAIRTYPGGEGISELKAVADYLNKQLQTLTDPLSLDVIRGIEGDAAKNYFSVFKYLVVEQKEAFKFNLRSRRPPLDNMNAILSFLYTILAHDVAAAIECVGIDPAVGFLHRDRPGRAGLALDMMEEFRPYIADRLALTMVNLKQIQGNGFQKTESGAVTMDDATRKTVLIEYQKRKQEQIKHPYLKENVEIGLLPYIQAALLSRYLRGELDNYPAFIAR
nr:type I-C CRISPR-associated endonuclease Cas1c [Dehalococcoides mccartyi]